MHPGAPTRAITQPIRPYDVTFPYSLAENLDIVSFSLAKVEDDSTRSMPEYASEY